MRYMTAEDRLDAEDARMRDAVVEAALAWRKVYRRYDSALEHLEWRHTSHRKAEE